MLLSLNGTIREQYQQAPTDTDSSTQPVRLTTLTGDWKYCRCFSRTAADKRDTAAYPLLRHIQTTRSTRCRSTVSRGLDLPHDPAGLRRRDNEATARSPCVEESQRRQRVGNQIGRTRHDVVETEPGSVCSTV
ncbi:hypothetical protein DPEC_G00020130 [Dallia pectoralis]|uniref:Uncharacterized protein n=1 Tax=Dallia pectoralis TaxID=75939 RepID=A0ACC2HG90_DALPE|nr:hypothetical protein DPEC_G00020130 [Dallia pectoralis]